MTLLQIDGRLLQRFVQSGAAPRFPAGIRRAGRRAQLLIGVVEFECELVAAVRDMRDIGRQHGDARREADRIDDEHVAFPVAGQWPE